MPDAKLTVRDLPQEERFAFLGWFAGGRNRVVKYATRPHVFMGKSECEQVDFEAFWLRKLPEIGWVSIEETRRFTAIGMVGKPEAIEYEISATDAGWEAQKQSWGSLRATD